MSAYKPRVVVGGLAHGHWCPKVNTDKAWEVSGTTRPVLCQCVPKRVMPKKKEDKR